MTKNYTMTVAVILVCAGSCQQRDSKQINHEREKLAVAYAFLLGKLGGDNVSLIASEHDENLELLNDIIKTNKLDFEVEYYADIERGPDFCYYSKSTKKQVTILGVTKRDERNYYISYYMGPEGGASKEIQIEERNGQWEVVNDDERWIVK